MPQRILIIEDDPIFRSVVRDNLAFEGYQVEAVGTGNAALARVREFAPDLVLLDLTLPDIDGPDLCRRLRRGGKSRDHHPVGARAEGRSNHRVEARRRRLRHQTDRSRRVACAYSSGARRAHPTVVRMAVGRLVVDFRTQRATCGDQPVHLTHREFELLRYLAERRDRVVHRDELLREVWGYLVDTTMTRTVDQTIARLRKKIEPDPHHPEFLRTAYSDGYCLSTVEEN